MMSLSDLREDIRALGRALRTIRQAKAESLDFAAFHTGISRLTILNFETGRSDPKLSTVIALADHCGLALVFEPKETAHVRRLPDRD